MSVVGRESLQTIDRNIDRFLGFFEGEDGVAIEVMMTAQLAWLMARKPLLLKDIKQDAGAVFKNILDEAVELVQEYGYGRDDRGACVKEAADVGVYTTSGVMFHLQEMTRRQVATCVAVMHNMADIEGEGMRGFSAKVIDVITNKNDHNIPRACLFVIEGESDEDMNKRTDETIGALKRLRRHFGGGELDGRTRDLINAKAVELVSRQTPELGSVFVEGLADKLTVWRESVA